MTSVFFNTCTTVQENKCSNSLHQLLGHIRIGCQDLDI